MCEEILRIPLKKDSLSQRSAPPLGWELSQARAEDAPVPKWLGYGRALFEEPTQRTVRRRALRPSNASIGLETMRKSPFSMRSAPKKARPR